MYEGSAQIVLSQSTLFAEDFPVRTYPWQADARALLESGQGFGSSSTGFLQSLNRSGALLRTSPACYQVTTEGTLPSSFGGWSNSGMAFAGGYWTLSTSEFPSDAAVCSLSEVLEASAPQRYFLSPKACAGILRRAEKRGREAALTSSGVGTCGADDNQAQAGHLVSFQETGHGWFNESPVGQCLRTPDGGGSQVANLVAHSLNAHGQRNDGESETFVPAYAIQHAQIGRKDEAGPQGKGWQEDVAFTLDSRAVADAVAFGWNKSASQTMRVDDTAEASPTSNPAVMTVFQQNQRDEVRDLKVCAGALAAEPGMKQQNYLAGGYGVRRLMPIECERLQGFPDGWTEGFADSARYRMLGNAVSVPVAAWIGKRLVRLLNAA